MDPVKISSLLRTSVLGRNLVFLEETDSTNAEATRRVEKGEVPDGTVIISERQSAGKGTQGRKWHSDGGLCMTVLLKGGEGPFLTLAAGIGLVQGLAALGWPDFHLKYPNDVYSANKGGKKVAGILTEAKRGFFIIGIGVNVTQESFPPELAEKAASLKQLGMDAGIEEVTASVLNSLEPWLERYQEGNFGVIREMWLKLDRTRGARVTTNGVTGRAAGIDEDGFLLVETAAGTVKINSGIVEMES